MYTVKKLKKSQINHVEKKYLPLRLAFFRSHVGVISEINMPSYNYHLFMNNW